MSRPSSHCKVVGYLPSLFNMQGEHPNTSCSSDQPTYRESRVALIVNCDGRLEWTTNGKGRKEWEEEKDTVETRPARISNCERRRDTVTVTSGKDSVRLLRGEWRIGEGGGDREA